MIDHAGEILILTGAPGSGKTTVAEALARRPGSPKAHLHADDFWHFIKTGAIAPYLPEAHSQNEMVMDVLANAANGYARGGHFVIVDGIIGPWFLPPFRALTTTLHYVVLRPPVDIAVERCRHRGGDTLTDPAPIRALHGQFAALGELDRHALATDGLDQLTTQLAVVAALESAEFRLAG